MKEKTARTLTPKLGLELPDVLLPDIRDHPTLNAPFLKKGLFSRGFSRGKTAPSLTLQSLLFSISLLFPSSDSPSLFLSFPRIVGVPRREKPLLFSWVSLAFFQKSKGWRVRVRTKSVKRPIKVGKRPINEGKRPIKAMVLVGMPVGCLMGCFRAPPPWRKTVPPKRPIKRSMAFVQKARRSESVVFFAAAVVFQYLYRSPASLS